MLVAIYWGETENLGTISQRIMYIGSRNKYDTLLSEHYFPWILEYPSRAIIPMSTLIQICCTCQDPTYGSNVPSMLDITLSCISWWGSSSTALSNVEYSFIVLTSRSTLARMVVPIRALCISQKLFKLETI